MQTALQELIDKIEAQREDGNTDLRTTLFYARRLLEVEKQQIINAHREGQEFSLVAGMPDSVEYFTQTYHQ